MASEHAQSQSQSQRSPLSGHRSISTVNNQVNSLSTSPGQGKQKSSKHVVGGTRNHTRVPSSKGLHKLAKAHGNEGSHTDLKKLAKISSSTTTLKKNSSHVSLKRNRSSVDVTKRPKSSHGLNKRPTSVHFEIGDTDGQDQEDGWEEASSSASPALSRSVSRPSSNQSSAKPSANSSQPQSPIDSPTSKAKASSTNVSSERQNHPQTNTDGKMITERLLKRAPSHNTTKMSLATATPQLHPADSVDGSTTINGATLNGTTLNDTPHTSSSKEEVVSRFVHGSGTPSENSSFLQQHHNGEESSNPGVPKNDEPKRAQSMGNLTRHSTSNTLSSSYTDEEDSSALAPHSRKSSTSHSHNTYIPPQQSRTQQKLWLQRASSNIEPQALSTPALTGIHGGLRVGVGGILVGLGAGYDGRDPRIKLQLERTGLEYLVVRRHQDPVGKALKRLERCPGLEGIQRIPSSRGKKGSLGTGDGPGRYGLSQSLKEARRGKGDKTPPAGRSSFEGQVGSHDEGMVESEMGGEDDGVGALLRRIWEKSFDLSASAD